MSNLFLMLFENFYILHYVYVFITKKQAYNNFRLAISLAEDTGFEPADAFTSTVFKTAALNHSANPPLMI